jgi:hypothetical protein
MTNETRNPNDESLPLAVWLGAEPCALSHQEVSAFRASGFVIRHSDCGVQVEFGLRTPEP